MVTWGCFFRGEGVLVVKLCIETGFCGRGPGESDPNSDPVKFRRNTEGRVSRFGQNKKVEPREPTILLPTILL